VNKLLNFYKLLNALSIDVALGAVCCSVGFAHLLHVPLSVYSLSSLGLTVWIIYTTDHLLDAKRIEKTASSQRHKIHQIYFKPIAAMLLLAIVMDIFLLFFISKQLVYYGFLLSCIIALYLFFNRRLRSTKEFLAAALYFSGVFLPIVSTGGTKILSVTSTIISFFITVLINMILFSWFDVQVDLKDDSKSIAVIFGDRIIGRFLIMLFVIQAVLLSIFAYTLTPSLIVMGAMNAVLFFLYFKRKTFQRNENYRLLGDAVFFFPVAYYLLIK
jgi:4-hydroxybenzoate polyprenyltransferase